MVMFGSSYPHWHAADVEGLSAGWTDEQRDKVLYRNAAKIYGLELAVSSTTGSSTTGSSNTGPGSA